MPTYYIKIPDVTRAFVEHIDAMIVNENTEIISEDEIIERCNIFDNTDNPFYEDRM